MEQPNPLEEIERGLSSALAEVQSEDEIVTLRRASMGDPLRGCPKLVKYSGGEELVEPGEWQNQGFGDDCGLPPDCPVRPLGQVGDEFYFLNTQGEIHTLKASSSGKGPIDALFAGRSRYLEWAWPRFGRARKNEKPPVMGYEADETRRCLFDACAYKGVFDDVDRVRGRGAWRDADGSLIYHAGDAVLIDGKWRSPGEIGPHVYPARPKLSRPAAFVEGGIGGPGDLVLQLLRTWNWDRGELDARLALGWLVGAMVGGALDWRPIIYLLGEAGCGKSTLQKLIRVLLNGAMVSTANTTAAGIYQKIKQDSLPVSIDELESEDDNRRAHEIIKLMRAAASGDKLLRGGADHHGKEFQLMSSFVASSINMPPIEAQDLSRMAILQLRELENPNGDKPVDARAMAEVGRQLMGRVFWWWPRWPALLQTFRKALISTGHDNRSADTFGTMAAAAHLAMWDQMPDQAQLDEWTGWLTPADLAETAAKDKNWRLCLMHLLKAQPQVLAHSHHKSVESALLCFRRSADGLNDVEKTLPLVGLTISFEADDVQRTWETARLFIPANSPALQRLYEGSVWAGRPGSSAGVWARALRAAPRHLWTNGKCDKGLDKKTSGLFLKIAAALE